MATIASYLKRPTAILRMPQAIARGLTPTKFLSQLKLQGLGYRKQRFLADWRNVSGTEKRRDALKFVRRDRRPPMAAIADVDWNMSQEYMYKVRAWVRKSPGEPLTERLVNIPSDNPMTPAEVEAAVFDRWGDWERYAGETLERAQTFEGYHYVEDDLGTPSPFLTRE